jgi:hypothetical protein
MGLRSVVRPGECCNSNFDRWTLSYIRTFLSVNGTDTMSIFRGLGTCTEVHVTLAMQGRDLMESVY